MHVLAYLGAVQASQRRARRRESSGTLPSFLTAPVLVGTPLVGAAMSFTQGSIAGSPTPTRSRQWLIDGANIPGATNLTYTPVAGDAGKQLAVRETITNVNGSASSTSASAAVTSVPSFSVAPTVSGTLNVGSVATAVPGTVAGSPTPTRTYQWLRNGVAISGATGLTYTTVAADIGTGTLSVRETATNSAGSTSSTSAAVNVAAVISLAWTASVSAGVDGYRLYSGAVSGVYDAPIEMGNVTSYTFAHPGSVRFYAITAVNSTTGLESVFTNELQR